MKAREYDYTKEPTISIVKSILSEAVKLRVSDIHFDPTPEELVIRFRIDGDLIEFTTAPTEAKKNILTRIKILASMNITENNIPQTGTIKYEDKQSSHNMLVSSLPTINGEKIVIHIADYHQSLNGIDSLLFSEDNLVKLKRLINLPNGIILICGSTSAGKTTTMYSLLKELDAKAKNIITVEDPVKMRIEGINQVQVAPEKGLTMSSILRSLLAQDPNVICLSEINNEEIARLALRASTTGRIVISTVHSKNASTTVDMLSNMNIETYLLASTLSGIISQRLVKKLCPKCRRQKEANTFEKTIIRRALNKNVNILYEPVGCNECIDGYQGRLPIAEVVEINNEMRTAIANHKDSDTLYNILYKDTNTILQDGLIMAMNGDTSFEEIMRVVDYESDFNKDNEAIKKTILGAATETMKESQKQIEQPVQEEINIIEPTPVSAPQLVEEVVPTPPPVEVTEVPIAETPVVEVPVTEPVQEVVEPTPIVEQPIPETPVVAQPAVTETVQVVPETPVVETTVVEVPVAEPASVEEVAQPEPTPVVEEPTPEIKEEPKNEETSKKTSQILAGLPKRPGQKRNVEDPMKKILADIKRKRAEAANNTQPAASAEPTPAPAPVTPAPVEEVAQPEPTPVTEAPAPVTPEIPVATPTPAAQVKEDYNDFSYDDDLDINNI